MRTVSIKFRFLHFSRVTSALVVSAMMLAPSPAYSLSLVKPAGRDSVSFPRDSAELSDTSIGPLARHFPRMNALDLEAVIVIATGDKYESESNKDDEMSLGLARAESVRQLLIDAGIPSRRIYSEAKLISPEQVRDENFLGPALGTAIVEYIGLCNIDNRSLCYQDPQAQPIIPPDAAR